MALMTASRKATLFHNGVSMRYIGVIVATTRQLGGKILYRESDIERVLQSCYRGKF